MTINGWTLYYRGPFRSDWYGLRSLFVLDIAHPTIKRIGPIGFYKL